MKSAPFAAFAFALSLSAAHAEGVPAALQGGLAVSVDRFSQSIGSGDLAATFDYLPPEVLELLARQAGISIEDMLAATRTQIEAAMTTVTIDAFTMDIAAADWQITPDGAVGYALIPTETLMTIEGNGRMKARSETLAFQDGEARWYLVRIDDSSQVSLLQAAYPAFRGVDFPVGTMELVE